MLAAASGLHEKFLNTNAAQYDKLSVAQKIRIQVLYRPQNLILDLYLDEDEDNLPPMPLLEDNKEEVKEGKE